MSRDSARQTKRSVMLVGSFSPGRLECSYRSAFDSLGYETITFDVLRAIERHCRLGRIGRLVNAFVPIQPWIRKANRDMVLAAIRHKPLVTVVTGQYPVQPGAIAQIKASTGSKPVYLWPDTLLNLDSHLVEALPLYDLVATYSKATTTVFEQLGAKRVEWVPLAADVTLQKEAGREVEWSMRADVSFIGGWRPERERLLAGLSDFDLKIWGPDWGRRCRGNRSIMRSWQGRAVRGSELARAVASSRINLNIIDTTNHPAANMRFFEIPAAGGLQVSSPCPEMESEFRHGEHLFYYRSAAELREAIQMLLARREPGERVAAAGHEKVLAGHTYRHRVQQIMSILDADAGAGGRVA